MQRMSQLSITTRYRGNGAKLTANGRLTLKTRQSNVYWVLMPNWAVGDNAGVVAGEDEEDEAERVVGRERESVVEEGVWSTSIGSDNWRSMLGVVMADLTYRKIRVIFIGGKGPDQ